MTRRVAYWKAILAGMAGAVIWEAVARLLILLGVPFADIVGTLGRVAAPPADPIIIWLVGMLLHLVVGAIWAVFYAYFFWSLLPLRPALQGLVFAFVPMPLAIVIMHPQLELMWPGMEHAGPSYSGVFGLASGGWHEPLAIVLGHLIWGAVMGWIYTHPVGYRPDRAPRLRAKATHRRLSAPAPSAAPSFMFATGIECSYPTLEHGRWRMDEMQACGHYRYWRTDLSLVRSLGLRYLRYGPPLHLIYRGPGRYDWSFLDEVAQEMQRLGIVPVMDLCHFGLPDWLGNFQNPDVPRALGEYAQAFARRYPWVRFYTPVNEMYVCAKLSALEGLWNEQRRDERSFVTAVRHLARASVDMTRAIMAEQRDAVFVNSESGEFFQPCCPDDTIVRIADFENERRFLPLDLIYAHRVSPAMRTYLRENGMPAEEYDWFMQQDLRARAILGVDYYEWNEKLVDRNGRSQALGELFGWYVIASQYYERYRLPMMHTETNRLDARDGPRWLWRQWHNVQLIRAAGVPVVGFTWYSLTDQVDWEIALRAPQGNVNPVGLFDLNRDPRLVGLAYKHLIQLFAPALEKEPALDSLFDAARQQSRQEKRRQHA